MLINHPLPRTYLPAIPCNGGQRESCSGLSLSEARSSNRSYVVPQRLSYWQTAAAAAQTRYHRHLKDLRRLQRLVWLLCGRWRGWLLWWVGSTHGGCLIADFSWKLVKAQVRSIHLSLSFWTAQHSPTPTTNFFNCPYVLCDDVSMSVSFTSYITIRIP